VVLVQSDNLSAVVSYAISPGGVLFLANSLYQPGVAIVIDKNITITTQAVVVAPSLMGKGSIE
jgi:hypothetical protein